MGTVANEIAGERLIQQAFTNACEAGEFDDFVINKRVVDRNGKTWGYHESYLVDAEEIGINPGDLALLGLHLATRNIFCGAGAMSRFDTGEARYVLSQKNNGLRHDYHTGTTETSKALVNLRDEPLADREHWRRVHVTSGDPTMSPWSTFLKLGSTSLVLRLAEHNINLPKLQAKDLCQLARHVAYDTSLKQPQLLISERKLTAAEIQTELCAAASELAQSVELPAEEQLVLQTWQSACDLARKNPAKLAEKTDWGAKQMILSRYRRRHQIAWNDSRLMALDWRWDRLSETGLAQKVRRGSWAADMPPEELITERMDSPPDSTRAALRAQFIASALKHHGSRMIGVDWSYVSFDSEDVRLSDPYATTSDSLSQLMAYIAEEPVLEESYVRTRSRLPMAVAAPFGPQIDESMDLNDYDLDEVNHSHFSD